MLDNNQVAVDLFAVMGVSEGGYYSSTDMGGAGLGLGTINRT